MGGPAYDAIGLNYADVRRTDPRIAEVVWSALGDAASVVNVGAGTGSYEPRDRAVVAVEPSAVMIAQRPRGSAPAVRAAAEALPLGAEAVDAALAVLTVQHWRDIERGIEELLRVARRRVVLVTMDVDVLSQSAGSGIRGMGRCARSLRSMSDSGSSPLTSIERAFRHRP
jgi:SAM-dependent methyltransferase